MNEFTFKIGDWITIKQDKANLLDPYTKQPAPLPRFQIVGRKTEECIGGVQRFYAVRVHQRASADTTGMMYLAWYAPYEVEAVVVE